MSPNAGLELPLVRVKGLDIGDGVRVFAYDRNLDGNYEVDADGAFTFRESGVYDIVEYCPSQDGEETLEQVVQPVDGQA